MKKLLLTFVALLTAFTASVQAQETEKIVVPEGEIGFTTLPVVGTLLDNNIGKSLGEGGVVWGSQSSGENYVDVTKYDSVKFYGTPGAGLRIFVNREGAVNVEAGKTEQRLTIGDNKVAALSVKDMMVATAMSHCYISAVKISSNWQYPTVSPATIDTITVVEPAPESSDIKSLLLLPAYSDDKYSCSITVAPTSAEGTALYYTYDAEDDPDMEMELVEGTIELGYTPGKANEDALCIFNVTVFELPEDSWDLEDAVAKGTMTITLFDRNDLTAEMFCQWDSYGADGNVVNTKVGAYEIGTSTGLPYGDGNVNGRNYADLSAYSTMTLTVVNGGPRMLFNRQGMDNTGDFIEINSEDSPYVTVEGKEWTINIAKIVEERGYAHLNCIKGRNYANVTINRILLEAAEPAEPAELTLTPAYNESQTGVTITVKGATGKGNLVYFLDDDEEPNGIDGNTFETAPVPGQKSLTVTVWECSDDFSVVYAQGTIKLEFKEDTPDAIAAVKAVNDGVAYDIAGRRVNAAAKGLYIINGKKVVK